MASIRRCSEINVLHVLNCEMSKRKRAERLTVASLKEEENQEQAQPTGGKLIETDFDLQVIILALLVTCCHVTFTSFFRME